MAVDKKEKVLIIGDSMVKEFKRWKINKKLKFTKVSVNCFPGTNTSDMKHYTKPPLKKNPNTEVGILHTGTNDLSSDSTLTEIATNIIDLAVDVNKNLNRSCDVMISSIIPRGDQLQQKAFNVNKNLNYVQVRMSDTLNAATYIQGITKIGPNSILILMITLYS